MLPDSDGFRIPIVFGRLGNQWNLESSGIKPSLELGTGGSQFQRVSAFLCSANSRRRKINVENTDWNLEATGIRKPLKLKHLWKV